MDTPKLPRWAADPTDQQDPSGEELVHEFIYGGPPLDGDRACVHKRTLGMLLKRVLELEALNFANEYNVKVSVEVDGRRVDIAAPSRPVHSRRR